MTLSGFSRKLGGVTSYDGLATMISDCYDSIAKSCPQPISLDEIDETSKLVDRLSSPSEML
jgi:hypothetical protein